jgi:hypothetical protein
MRPARPGGDNEGMSTEAWVVVLIVFLTMFAIQVAQFVWIEYLLHRIDVLEGDAPSDHIRRAELVPDAPLVDDPARKPRRSKLAAQA